MSENIEKIGNVVLNLNNYGGTDVYSDGDVEDRLLEIVKSHNPSEFPEVIERETNWATLYHLSEKRENIVEWIDVNRSQKVLEIGSGCGAITGVLSRKAGSVTCVDLSKRRSEINAYRHKDAGNIEIRVGNFTDVEPGLPSDYDYIFLIGVLEYGKCYIGGDKPFHTFLDIIKKHLKPDGKLVIAIENRLGLKYFAGCREDHLGSFFSGIENYPEGSDVRTFARPALEKIFKECGFDEYSFYYPYPDYKFPITIFSDNRLPKTGELVNNDRNFDRDRIRFFDEKKAFDAILADGLFPFFSNSYLVVLGKRPGIDYVRYSNDRQDKYAIRTTILSGENPVVKKTPMKPEGIPHIEKLAESCRQLTEKYYDGKLTVSKLSVTEGPIIEAETEFIKGRNLSEIFDEFLEKGDKEGFKNLFREFESRIRGKEEYPYSDRDLVFSNILVDGDKWTLIDYEWTVSEAIPAHRQAARALYCHALERGFAGFETKEFIMSIAGIERGELDSMIRDEVSFQREVNGERLSMPVLRYVLGNPVIDFNDYKDEISEHGRGRRVQIFTDRGEGFSEAASVILSDVTFKNGIIEFETEFTKDAVRLRLDPMFMPCVVIPERIEINGTDLMRSHGLRIIPRGKILHGKEKGYIFGNGDPRIIIRLKGLPLSERNVLSVRLKYSIIDEKVADILYKNAGLYI